jgi:hypothetical protein
MTEQQPTPRHPEKKLSFLYTTRELGERFLKESFLGDFSSYDGSFRQTGMNLKGILEKKFPGQSEFTEMDRTQILKEISEGKLPFGQMAFMLQVKHPMVKNWPEAEKRKSLRYILEKKISAFKKHLSEVKSGKPIRYVDESTPESIEREMAPYQNFRDRLSQRK